MQELKAKRFLIVLKNGLDVSDEDHLVETCYQIFSKDEQLSTQTLKQLLDVRGNVRYGNVADAMCCWSQWVGWDNNCICSAKTVLRITDLVTLGHFQVIKKVNVYVTQVCIGTRISGTYLRYSESH